MFALLKKISDTHSVDASATKSKNNLLVTKVSTERVRSLVYEGIAIGSF